MGSIRKNAKTVYVDDKPWSSPDGKVTIWTIKLEIDGQRDTLATMSKVVATEGFVGDVEIYTNDRGKTYVRQAPKDEDDRGGVQAPQQGELAAAVKKVWEPRNDDMIRAQWAIGQSMNYVGHLDKFPGYDAVERQAKTLYAMVDRVKSGPVDAEPLPTPPVDDVHDVTDEPINPDDIPF